MTADAGALDAADPLAAHVDRFERAGDVRAYLDGNSLGRPVVGAADDIARFVREEWGGRLIRGWDEGWMELGQTVGDDLGRVCLGAAAAQTTIGDSTSVLLYKVLRGALDLRADRDEIIVSRDDFPTDRYIVEGIAAERGFALRWVDTPAAVEPTQRTALVLLSHVAYRSGAMADLPAITSRAHEAGALVVWDLCHSAGVVPLELDAHGVDFAVGCTYKYLNGGPGSPAFAYVAARHLERFRQPIHGWLGSARPFEMGQGYEPAPGVRRVLSGTPPVIGTLAMRAMIALLDDVGLDAVREKSVALTTFAIELCDELVPDAVLVTPRDPALRGSHVTIDHPAFPAIVPRLWEQGVIPDFRRPAGIRLGLSPLSTSFAEVELGVRAIARELARHTPTDPEE